MPFPEFQKPRAPSASVQEGARRAGRYARPRDRAGRRHSERRVGRRGISI